MVVPPDMLKQTGSRPPLTRGVCPGIDRLASKDAPALEGAKAHDPHRCPAVCTAFNERAVCERSLDEWLEGAARHAQGFDGVGDDQLQR